MKKTNMIFWIVTGLFAAFMLPASIPDILLTPEAKAFMQHLGYPDYFTRLIGVLKLLGIIGLLVAGFPRIKEWVYAGFIFDLGGAVYSQIATDGLMPQQAIMLLPIGFCCISYIYFHKRLKHKANL